MVNLRKILVILLLTTIIVGAFAGCSTEPNNSLHSMDDFSKGKIGVFTGAIFDQYAKEYLPEAERFYFRSPTDLVLSLKQGKIDGILLDMAFYTPLSWEYDEISFIEMDLPDTEYAVAFPKTAEGEALKKQIDTFIRSRTESGWIAELEKKWFSGSEPDGSIDLSLLTGENGTLRVASTVDSKPFDYLKNGLVVGFDMDFLFDFAMEYGYALEIDTMDFGALLPSLAAERYDLAITGLTITEERKEAVLFSEPYYFSPSVMAVLNHNTSIETEHTLADFDNATLGIFSGSSFDALAKERFPNAQRQYYTLVPDMILAVEQGKIDGYITETTYVTAAIWEGAEIEAVEEIIDCTSAGFIFRKDDSARELREQLNAFIRAAKENGTIAQLQEKWFAETEPTGKLDFDALTGENGTLRLGVAPDLKPISYIKDGEATGYEMELLLLFAKEYGYQLEVSYVTFDAILPGVTTGKYDIGTGAITITEERAQSVDFTDSHLTVDVVMVVKRDASQSEPQKTLADLQNGKLAILTGTIWDGVAQKEFPNAERKYFSSMTDMTLSLEQRKVDGILGDKTFYVNARWENVPVCILDDTIGSISCGFMLAKDTYDPVLYEQLNAFIMRSEQDGTLDALYKKWLSDAEPSDHPDYRSLSGENGTLKIAVDSTAKPMTYQKGDMFTGYDVELLTEFARAYGYSLDFMGMSFSGLIPAVASEKCDIGACGIAITPERAESVTFTTSYETIEGVAIVSQGAESVAQTSFWDELKEDFHKTFIRENRWKLIVEGIGVTMLISICAAIAGTLLGFGLYMLSRADAKVLQVLAQGIAKVYSRIIAGTPVVVILMILFYVVFGKFRDMSGILVAIIGFTLTFGAFVYDHMTVSVRSVDYGQTEAAYALGYTKNQTFFRIIFPQAMTVFLPSYCGQAVELIKATAVVGYVAVNDLTKMGDIIRSNTYEAFFPLIATAVIYFLLTWILSLLLGFLKRHFEPKRRSKEDILKGVKTI